MAERMLQLLSKSTDFAMGKRAVLELNSWNSTYFAKECVVGISKVNKREEQSQIKSIWSNTSFPSNTEAEKMSEKALIY